MQTQKDQNAITQNRLEKRKIVSLSIGNDDPTTGRTLEVILAMEEEHADDLVSLLEELGS